MSAWLRDYLYRTLRGDTRDAGLRMYRNLFLTMLLGGLWHGANWTFVVWGAIHGASLVLERIIKTRWHEWRPADPQQQTSSGGFVAALAGWLVTFHVFTFAAIFFRSPDIALAQDYIAAMFSYVSGVDRFTPFLLLLVGGSVALQFLPADAHERAAKISTMLPVPLAGIAFALGLLLIEYAGPRGVAPFIYFQF